MSIVRIAYIEKCSEVLKNIQLSDCQKSNGPNTSPKRSGGKNLTFTPGIK
jgi:hypothetical protein